MKLTLFDPSLTDRQERGRTVQNAVHNVALLIIISQRWTLEERRIAIQYVTRVHSVVSSFAAQNDWRETLLENVPMEKISEIDRMTELQIRLEQICESYGYDEPVPVNEFSSLGIVP